MPWAQVRSVKGHEGGMYTVPYSAETRRAGVAAALPKVRCARRGARCRRAGCRKRPVRVHRTTYCMYTSCTVLYRSAPRRGDRADRLAPRVEGAQPLWLVMMRNVGKCHPVWCVTGMGYL